MALLAFGGARLLTRQWAPATRWKLRREAPAPVELRRGGPGAARLRPGGGNLQDAAHIAESSDPVPFG